MAPVLQCPDCGEKHPITRVPGSGAFPCQGCGRILKVPEAVAQRIAAGAGGSAAAAAGGAAGAGAAVKAGAGAGASTGAVRPDPGTPRPVPIATAVANPNAWDDGEATGSVGQVDGTPRGGGTRSVRRPVPRLGPVPWWMRLLLWIVAVPLSFLFVFLVARVFNLFTSDQLSNLFLANDSSRFWPAVRLLPFVALVTAALVQLGVFGLARLRGRRLGGTRTFEELSGPPRPAGRSRATS